MAAICLVPEPEVFLWRSNQDFSRRSQPTIMIPTDTISVISHLLWSGRSSAVWGSNSCTNLLLQMKLQAWSIFNSTKMGSYYCTVSLWQKKCHNTLPVKLYTKSRYWSSSVFLFCVRRANTEANVQCFPAAHWWNSVSPIDYSSISLDHLGFNNMPETGSASRPLGFFIPLWSFMMLCRCVHSLYKACVPSLCVPYLRSQPIAAIHMGYINTCNQLLSDDIWRMWQVNIFCHFTALLGNWLILHRDFWELYDEGSRKASREYIAVVNPFPTTTVFLILPHEAWVLSESTEQHAIIDAIAI